MNYINDLIKERQECIARLNSLIYGSVEVRESKGEKYIYLHYNNNGVRLTRYAGVYSDELYNLILNNNILAKDLKRKIKQLTKDLKSLGYIDNALSEKVALNIDFAKRHMVDTIYKQAVLEGIATTYADTETIIEGGKVNNLSADDVLKVVNLKRAWQFILDKDVLEFDTNFALLCEINRLVLDGFYYNGGKLRTTPVSIGGTKWKPQLPMEGEIKQDIKDILDSADNISQKAIKLLLYVMKKQIFIDGNKRTAVIFANHLLIKNACGLIVVPENLVDKFKTLLIYYYESGKEDEILAFLEEQIIKL